jgi:hypothetical protein
MSEDEIRGYINTIQAQQKKTIKLAYEKSKNLREEIIKNTKKVREGGNKLIEETDPQLTEEGVKRITKKGKIYFRSLKAINKLTHFITNEFADFQIPDPSRKLTSGELSQFIRVLSRLVNDTNRERAAADSIMGLDFMLKKRSIYGPINKIGSDLSKLRDIQKGEYRIIKILEDLENLVIDVRDILGKLSQSEEDLERLRSEYEDIKESKNGAEDDLSIILEDPLIKDSRQRGIRMTELEIEMGKHLNSFKKIFKKYAREVQRGSFSGDFGLVGTALAYEENPVQQFLKEENGNPEITVLLEELFKVGKSNLHLKQKDINNIRKELNLINQGKLDSWKKEWKHNFTEKQKEGASSEFRVINDKLIKIEKKVEQIKTSLNEKEEEIALKKKEINQYSESLTERYQRSSDLANESEKWNN